MLDSISTAERAYIAHDLPDAVTKELFAPAASPSGIPKNGPWAVVAAALRSGSALIGGGILFRLATIRSFLLS
jgi:hypothetical protein